MAELIAQGLKPNDRWRRPLPVNQAFTLGRAAGTFAVPWDDLISRQHAELTWRDGLLEVQRLPSARNPIFVQGKESPRFQLKPGEHFVIGRTTFCLADAQVVPAAGATPLVKERTFSIEELEKIQFRDAPHQIDVLSKLPDLISGAADDTELFVRLVNLLLVGISMADVAALVALDAASPDNASVPVLHWDRRLSTGGTFQPSQRLVLEAIRRRKQTVLHVWSRQDDSNPSFTHAGNFDWAFCTPVRGEASKGWGIYVAGRFTTSDQSAVHSPWEITNLGDDLKFTELVAAILSSLRQVHLLQRKQASLSHFFSPAVLRTLTGGDPEVVLKPRQTEVTVLFCDLRGFSRESEKHGDDLLALLQRVSKALGVMTQNILDQGGVIGDFHGDAAMGFWGWPLPQPDAVRRACLAALGIRTLFEMTARRSEHPLTDFKVGIGIATGTAVAGKIGTVDQVKVTVFGPVVNLASRLEGMTKIWRTPILLDEVTARLLREQVGPETARCRRLARVRPYGMDRPLVVSELLPPFAEYPALSDAHIADYEAAVDALLKGEWPRAWQMLHKVPPEDQAKDFLTVFIAQHNRTPPPGWDGVIELDRKS
jgi:adenylate cyclase